jgi:hypothetical protein
MPLTFTISETEEVIVSAGETASWYLKLEVPAGTYEAVCFRDYHSAPCSLEDADWVSVAIPATCVGGWIPGYRGSNEAEKQFGEPMVHGFKVYAFMVQDSIASGLPTRWALT